MKSTKNIDFEGMAFGLKLTIDELNSRLEI